MRKRLLWIGDGPDCPSGFGRATREILNVLRETYDIVVLGINHLGDPGTVPYPVYTCSPGGDHYGVGRLVWLLNYLTSIGTPVDVICIQQDTWNIQPYILELEQSEHAKIPVIGVLAVDGKNIQAAPWLRGLSHAIFWTQFALDEARSGGYLGPATVIPLGVDLEVYYPEEKYEALAHRRIDVLAGKFIVGNVNRNQPRKRWDLTIKYFATWVKTKKIHDAFLYLHVAPTGDVGVNVRQLMQYYGVIDRLALMDTLVWHGIPEDAMRHSYNCFDVQVSTTQGEGFGLTTFEAMACGVPQIAPDWSALGDLCRDAALLVPCATTAIGPPYQNIVGGVADEAQFIEELDAVYRDAGLREHLRYAGLDLVSEPRFRWSDIGQRYAEVLARVLAPASDAPEDVWRDVTPAVAEQAVPA